MPVHYIRNKKLHKQYKALGEPAVPQLLQEHAKDVVPPPFQQATPVKRRKGQQRDYMTEGYLQALGSTP
jgi:hypothetical protein